MHLKTTLLLLALSAFLLPACGKNENKVFSAQSQQENSDCTNFSGIYRLPDDTEILRPSRLTQMGCQRIVITSPDVRPTKTTMPVDSIIFELDGKPQIKLVVPPDPETVYFQTYELLGEQIVANHFRTIKSKDKTTQDKTIKDYTVIYSLSGDGKKNLQVETLYEPHMNLTQPTSPTIYRRLAD